MFTAEAAEYTEKTFNGKPNESGFCFPIKNSALSAPSAVNNKPSPRDEVRIQEGFFLVVS